MFKNKKYIYIGIILLSMIGGFLYLNKEKQIQMSIPVDKNYKFIKVSLQVEDKNYITSIVENGTVFDAMEQIKKENKEFDFKYTKHAGLGVFVDEIDGIKGERDAYWIYYVNNKKAGIGVSHYILKDGDIINWKQEKNI